MQYTVYIDIDPKNCETKSMRLYTAQRFTLQLGGKCLQYSVHSGSVYTQYTVDGCTL